MEAPSSSEGGSSGPSTSSSPLGGDRLEQRPPRRSQTLGSDPSATLVLSPIAKAPDRITSEPAAGSGSRLRSWSSGSRGRGSPREPRWTTRVSRKKAGSTPPGDLPEEVAPLVSRRPVQFFKEKHILVEMNELRGTVWMETHRWNFGLEEDLADDGHVESSRPHLPWISAFGLTQLATSMQTDTIILDPPAVRTFTALVDVVAKAVASHTDAAVADSVREVLGYQIWDHHIRTVPEHEHESKAEHDERAKYGYHKDEEQQQRRRKRESWTAGQDGHFERLIPDEAEESANILVGAVDWLQNDVIVVVRLNNAIRVRELSDDDPTGHDNFPPTKIFAIILGPPREGPSCIRHVEMGEALAALLQDEDVLKGFYGALSPQDVLDVINVKMHKLTIMPQILQPSKKAIKEKTKQLRETLFECALTRFPKNQVDKWSRRAGVGLDSGLPNTATGVLTILRKYAMPLVFGVILALILKNTDEDWYDLALGPAHHSTSHGGNITAATEDDSSNTTASNITASNITASCEHSATEGHHDVVPTTFGFSLDGHDVNFYFIVNDILMCFFFGLAAQEITESFIPGGMMHPIGRSIMNPLGATLGGVLGPVIMYFVLLSIFDSAGSFDDQTYEYKDLVTGWGIPTATDIAICWAVAVVVFGAGHPAIKYLLLLAIVDDGIGLIIIAVAYPDPEKPAQPQWLGLVALAMVMSYMFRRWKWKEWWLWVLLAGPVSWYGLIRSGIHPALALCFVVPFMPGAPADDDDKTTGHGGGGGSNGSDDEDDALDKSTASMGGHDGHKSHSTLQNFEHAIKGFVDLIVLFSFGLASAGVDLSGFGPYTAVVVLSLVLGKSLGISLCALLMVGLGFPFPAGMNMRCACMVAFIASIGLTVALFVAGEAYPTSPVIAGEAKLGALCSIMVSVVAVAIGQLIDLSPEPVDAVTQLRKSKAAGGEDGVSLTSERKRTLSDSSDDELLEAVYAKDALSRLGSITRSIKKVEDETHVSRQEAMGVFRKHANAIRDKVKVINALRGATGSSDNVAGKRTTGLTLKDVVPGKGLFLAAVKAQKAKEDAAEAKAAKEDAAEAKTKGMDQICLPGAVDTIAATPAAGDGIDQMSLPDAVDTIAANPAAPPQGKAEVDPNDPVGFGVGQVNPIQAAARRAATRAKAARQAALSTAPSNPMQERAAARRASRCDMKKKAADAAKHAAVAMQAAADAAAQVAVDAEKEALLDSGEDEEDPLAVEVVQVSNSSPGRTSRTNTQSVMVGGEALTAETNL